MQMMNLDNLHKKVIAVARSNSPESSVPYAFEKRIMHRINSEPAVDAWAVWSRALWKAAGPCVGVALLVSAWSAFGPDSANGADDGMSADIESTVLSQFYNSNSNSGTW